MPTYLDVDSMAIKPKGKKKPQPSKLLMSLLNPKPVKKKNNERKIKA